MSWRSLSPDMKSAIALIVAWIILLVVGVLLTIVFGPPDIYAAASIVIVVPYLVFLYFGTKRKAWAYLGSSVLSALVVVAVPFSIQQGMTDILLWESMMATLLATLIALESYKGYLECKAAN